jgi:HK97 family phage portal protein
MLISNGSLVTKTPTFTTDGYFPWTPPMSGGWPSAYGAMYKSHLWVYVLVNKLARAEARLPLPVYERDDLNRPRADDHPLAMLLRQPNPALSGFDLWLWTRSMRGIFGEAFWLKDRTAGVPTGLYPLHPASMRYNDEGTWDFDNGKLVLKGIKDIDLVTFKSFNPDSSVRGLSPMEPLRSTLESEWSSRQTTNATWAQGARPGVLLTHPKNISEGAQKRLKAEWNSVAAGPANAGATVLLEEGMTAEKWTLTNEEAQYIEGRKLNREEACAAYDVPPPVVHILDRATFSNITEQMRSMYRDTMAPLLKEDESVIEQDLRRAEWPNDDVYAEFLMDEVLRGDFEARADAYQKANYMTIAEKRKAENLPFIVGTDRIFMNTATLPLDAIDAQAAALVAETGGDGAEVIPLHAVRSVMGRLSWQQALSQVDLSALVDGLNGSSEAVMRAFHAESESGGDVASLRKRISAMAGDQ